MQGDGDGVLSNLVLVERLLVELAKIDPEMGSTARLASEAKVLLKEVVDSLRSYEEHVDADPGRLMAVEDRLAVLQKMKKKYGGTIEAVLRTYGDVKDELEQLSQVDDQRADLDRLIAQQQEKVSELAGRLSQMRKEAAKRLTKMVAKELEALKMGSVRFVVQVVQNELDNVYGPDGIDRVEFLLAANAGEPLKAMSRTASGGEISRLMLALKSVLANVDHVPVLIFDEIDTGVGGAVAAAIGKRLRALGQYHQVLCITHLPQVASQAQHHVCVEKLEVKGRTVTTVRSLSGVNREGEIARMLGGERVTTKTRATAAELIAGSHE
jgi:DNA repair protein RecN (Recombination protein N)